MQEPISPPLPDLQRLQNELQFLSELAVVVASNTELQPILDWIVGKTVTLLSADEGSIRLSVNLGDNTTRTVIIKPASNEIASGSWPRHVSMSVMGFLSSGRPLGSADLHNDSRFLGLQSGEPTRIRAVLAVPLMVNNRVTGMLAVTESKPGRQWSPNDLQLLAIVAGHSAAAIEQARLRAETMLKRELEEKNRRLEEELERARETQMTLVPSEPLRLGPWLAVGRIIPARAVGGDAFDFYPLSETRFAVAIADVSGKGIPAALLMSNVVASVRAFCNGRSSIPDAIRFVNRGFTRTVSSGKFITLFYGELDVAEGVFRFVNAGHNPPLLRRRDGTIERLSEGGVPIGLFEEWDYVQGEVGFRPGDSLLLYSDGVTEAFDAFGGEYGEQRLEQLWQTLGHGAPGAIVDATLEDVANFRGHAEQSDDMTVVVVGAPPA